MGQYNFTFESVAQAEAFAEFFRRLKRDATEEDAAVVIAPDRYDKILTNELWVKRSAQAFQFGYKFKEDEEGQAEAIEGQGKV